MRFVACTFLMIHWLVSSGQPQDCNGLFSTELSPEEQEESIRSLSVNNRSDSISCARCYHEYAKTMYRSGRYTDAIEYAKKAAEFRQALRDTIQLKKSLFNLGVFQSRAGRILGGIQTYLALTKLRPEDKTYGKAHSQLGALYITSGDFHNALIHLQHARDVFSRIGATRDLYKNYLELARLYAVMDAPGFASEILHALSKVDSLGDYTPIDERDRVITYQRQASLQDDLGNYAEAILAYEKALKIIGPDGDLRNLTLNNLAVTERKNGDYAQAEQHLKTAFAETDDKRLQAMICNNLGDLMMDLNEMTQALDYYQRSVHLYTRPSSSEPFESPDSTELRNSPYRTELLTALISLSDYWWQKWASENDTMALHTCMQYLHHADFLIELLVYESASYESRLFWRREAARLYQKAVRACYAARDAFEAYYFMERNKAFLLMANLSRLQAQENALIPDRLITQENDLHREMIRARQTLYDTNEDHTGYRQSLHKAIFAYQSFRDSLKRAYPTYKKYLERTVVMTLRTHHENYTRPGSCDLLYLTTPEHCYGLAIARDTTRLFRIRSEELAQQLEAFRELIQAPFRTEADMQNYVEVSHGLYQILLAPVLEHGAFKQLRISADGLLQSLNFEALNESPYPDDLATTLLIRKARVSYVYSFSHDHQSHQLTRRNNDQQITFTPGTFLQPNLERLPGSVEEGKHISELTGSGHRYGEASTRQAFVEALNKYETVHLATHADFSSRQEPHLYFYKDQLRVREIYAMKSNANLVVLSACGTSKGPLAQGEGVMSLARAFSYAGTGQMVSTLGNINDGTSEKIMTGFYNHLEENPASEALRQAKLDYLQNSDGKGLSPYYWAVFVCIGSDQTVKEASSWSVAYIAGAASLLFLLVVSVRLFQRQERFKVAGKE